MPWTFYNSNGQRLSSAATNISNLDIDGATDIGAAIVDADLFIIDDGAGGTNRKTEASRLKTYVGSAVTREGGNTSEATTTSTSASDLLSATSLTIAVAEPFLYTYVGRRTTGSAAVASSTLKLNSTAIYTVASTNTWDTGATNLAMSGSCFLMIPARVANYLKGLGSGGAQAVRSNNAHEHSKSSPGAGGQAADYPTDEITSVIVVGSVGNSAVTLGCDELQVYSLAAT